MIKLPGGTCVLACHWSNTFSMDTAFNSCLFTKSQNWLADPSPDCGQTHECLASNLHLQPYQWGLQKVVHFTSRVSLNLQWLRGEVGGGKTGKAQVLLAPAS